MSKVLVPIDGSIHALHALDLVLKQRAEGHSQDVHLLNVQPQVLSGHARMYLKREMIDEYHQEEALKALKPAQDKLDQAGVPYVSAHLVGHIAETIDKYARTNGCDHIVMGTRGLGSIGSLMLGSVASKLLHLADVPVTLVK